MRLHAKNRKYCRKHLVWKASMNKKKLNDQILEFLELSDINALIEKAGEKLGAGLAFRYDDSSRTIARSSSYEFLNNAKSFPLNEIERLYDTRRIIDGSQSCGVLILDRRPPGKNDFLVDALIIGLRFLFRREKNEENNKNIVISRFFEDLILNRVPLEQENRKRAELLGIPADEEILLFVVDGLPLALRDFVLMRLKAFFHRSYFIARKKLFICIAFTRNIGEDALKENIKQFVHAVRKSRDHEASDTGVRTFDDHYGVGGRRSSLLLLSESFAEAKGALVFSHIHARQEPIFWRETGAFRQICLFATSAESEDFCRSILGQVIAYDTMHRSNLLTTLAAIESCNYNLALAAEKLFFHYNTIKYRYGKIQELLHGDLKDNAFRFDLSFALRAHAVREMMLSFE